MGVSNCMWICLVGQSFFFSVSESPMFLEKQNFGHTKLLLLLLQIDSHVTLVAILHTTSREKDSPVITMMTGTCKNVLCKNYDRYSGPSKG